VSTPTPSSTDESAIASVRLTPGLCWLERYQIQRASEPLGGGNCFTGGRLSDGLEVGFRQLDPDADTAVRRSVWQRLSERPLPDYPPLLETIPMEAGRVEVWQRPTGLSLAEWVTQQKLAPEDVLTIVQSLAKALLAVHERGLVYLRLSPEWVQFAGDTLDTAVLLHPELCVLIGQEPPVPNPLNALRMPPEGLDAAELKVTEPLKAWDWWTLGRFAQELILDKPVAALAGPRELARDSKALLPQAEALLREQAPGGSRAGGAELMPDLPVSLEGFLRGVLTTKREARWGAADIAAWLKGGRPRNHYDGAEATMLISFAGTALTVPEVAERFGSAEHWDEAVAQFKAEEPTPGSPLDVLLNSPGQLETEREWFQKARELREASALRHLSVAVRTEALAALAWLGVAPTGTKLRWRGHAIDAAYMLQLVKDDTGLSIARALCTRAFVELVQQRDAPTAWSLRMWGHEWEEAENLAQKHRWLRRGDSRRALAAYIFRGGEARARALKQGRETFKLTRIEPLQAMFFAENHSPAQLAIVGYTLERPQDFEYITHPEWLQLEQTRLRQRAGGLVDGVHQVRAARAVSAGRTLFTGTLAWWSGAGVALAAAALYWPGLGGTLLTLLLIGLLWLVRYQVGRTLQSLAPAAEGERWRWHGLPQRLRHLAASRAEMTPPVRVPELRAELKRVNHELTSLAITPKPEPIPLGRARPGLWIAGTFGWIVLGGLLALIGWRGSQTPWSIEKVATDWARDFTWLSETWESATTGTGRIELPSSVKKPAWPYVSSGVVHPVAILERFGSDERQRVVMKRFLLMLQEEYEFKSLHGLVAVVVPLADGTNGGVMVLDIGSGKLASGDVFRLEQMPVRGMTIDLDGLQAVYLDAP
jgi:hypothetical protein